MVNKVLVSEDEKGQEVHYINTKFINAEKTLCGVRLQPINTVYITNKKIPVTCFKCKQEYGKSIRSGK